MRLPALPCCALAAALAAQLACTPAELPVLTFDTRSRACVDALADGACESEWSHPGDPDLYSDYLREQPYVGVVVVTLQDGSYIEFTSPGAVLDEAREITGATVLSYTIDDDEAGWARLGERVRIDTAGTRHVGGDTDTAEARLMLQYRYSPEGFSLRELERIEVHVLLRHQNQAPGSPVPDDQPVVYGGRALFEAGTLESLVAGMGPDNVLDLLSDPLLMERWEDSQGQPVDRVEALSVTVLP